MSHDRLDEILRSYYYVRWKDDDECVEITSKAILEYIRENIEELHKECGDERDN